MNHIPRNLKRLIALCIVGVFAVGLSIAAPGNWAPSGRAASNRQANTQEAPRGAKETAPRQNPRAGYPDRMRDAVKGKPD